MSEHKYIVITLDRTTGLEKIKRFITYKDAHDYTLDLDVYELCEIRERRYA
jgi:hypothetical protein